MDTKKMKPQGENIESILTPKHLPECKLEFGRQKEKRNTVWLKISSFSAVAAILACVAFAPFAFNSAGELRASTPPMEIAGKGLDAALRKKCIYMELNTLIAEKLPAAIDKEWKECDCKAYFYVQDSVVYMREEWGDEGGTVFIIGKDSAQIWHENQRVRELRIPFRPVRYEKYLHVISKVLEKCTGKEFLQYKFLQYKIKKNLADNPSAASETFFTFDYSDDEIESVTASREGDLVVQKTKPTQKSSRYYTFFLSAEDCELRSVQVEEFRTSGEKERIATATIKFDRSFTLEDVLREGIQR